MIGESKGTDQHFNREYSKNIPFTIDTLRRIACFVVFWKADFVKKITSGKQERKIICL